MSEKQNNSSGVGLVVRGLRKSFGGQEVLKGVDIEVKPGEIFVIMGPSGSGKSVLLKHLIGLEEPDAGEILINGESITTPEIAAKYRMALVFQSGALLNSLTVGTPDEVKQFNDPRVIQLLKVYHDMYKLGIVPRDKVNSNNVQLFQQGKTMCEINVFGPGLDGIMTRTYGFNTISIPANSRGVKSTFSATGNMLAISATSKHPERTMMFLNLLNSDPYLSNLCAYGIEGVHWKAVGTDRLDFLPQHINYNASLVGNPFIGRLTPTDPDNLWDILKKANAAATKSPIFGFSFNPDPVKNEMSAIQNVKDEFVPHLFVGEVDVDSTLAKMNDKLNASGLDKVINEMQKQIDAWKKTQK